MIVRLNEIPLREALHFLGWRGTPVEHGLLEDIREKARRVIEETEPRVLVRRFSLEENGTLCGTTFSPKGEDVRRMLAPCREVYLLAATLGAQSERMLLREQSLGAAGAVLLDAVMSAAIEAICDKQEEQLRASLLKEGKYLTDRFSPGYGDMPMNQTNEICNVLEARRIGLTVSQNGIMIPRKSVTAIMGISDAPVQRRPSGCEGCSAKDTCAMRRNEG